MIKARLMFCVLVLGVLVGGRACLPWKRERRPTHNLPDCLEWYGYDDICVLG